MLLDAEVMPWSLKAAALITDQYASVGAAGRAMLPAAVSALQAAQGRGIEVAEVLEWTEARANAIDAYRAVYRRYCWPTDGLTGVRLAPFQLLGGGWRRWSPRWPWARIWHRRPPWAPPLPAPKSPGATYRAPARHCPAGRPRR
ncbi:MAG: hypothetical protein GEU86_16095 [Actinophytocola sp.]|nr:hypothetical protein [Actinophytocola sp.]